jgi:hypothetical protein
MFNEITLVSLMKRNINTNKKSSFFFLKQRLARQKGSSLHFKDLIQILSTISLYQEQLLVHPLNGFKWEKTTFSFIFDPQRWANFKDEGRTNLTPYTLKKTITVFLLLFCMLGSRKCDSTNIPQNLGFVTSIIHPTHL